MKELREGKSRYLLTFHSPSAVAGQLSSESSVLPFSVTVAMTVVGWLTRSRAASKSIKGKRSALSQFRPTLSGRLSVPSFSTGAKTESISQILSEPTWGNYTREFGRKKRE